MSTLQVQMSDDVKTTLATLMLSCHYYNKLGKIYNLFFCSDRYHEKQTKYYGSLFDKTKIHDCDNKFNLVIFSKMTKLKRILHT